ncbi:hypothetical protein BJF93_14270 [Xaviernesmea oryzae]|uniref:DUF1491 family protein n=1 Tax=Xaviernesmea oryzae TaxID=464029 RepID=A0A1Q9ARH5_9HYPH|nr:DUF1491 family protein [Xaviernesmea oryzae]OLP57988.1 hypothetical protein BJF93_14270 [Xaviernesmea oryzae]SEL27654.1 hypothetical protein SAMN04487976_1077 [Xaviernesmea oryzae]
MRLRSDLFVSALLRRVFADGGYAAVLHKGAAEAGAIFLRQRRRDGRESVAGPAPQSLLSGEESGDRLFELRLTDGAAEEADVLIARELRFDSDCWVVELECETLEGLVPLAPQA